MTNKEQLTEKQKFLSTVKEAERFFVRRNDTDTSIPLEKRPYFLVKNVYTRILMIIYSEPDLFPRKYFNRSTLKKYLSPSYYKRTDAHEKYIRKRWKHIDFDNFFVCQAIGQCFSQLSGPRGADLLSELAERGNELWQEIIFESAPTIWQGTDFFRISEAYSNTTSMRLCKWFPELLFRNQENNVFLPFRSVMLKYSYRSSQRDYWTPRYSKPCEDASVLLDQLDKMLVDSTDDSIYYEGDSEELTEEWLQYSVNRFKVSLFKEIEHK